MSIRFLCMVLLLLGLGACTPGQDASSPAKDPASSPQTPQPENKAEEAVPLPKAAPAPPLLEQLGLKVAGAIAPRSPDHQWMYECVQAARSGDFAGLQSFIHPQKGLFFLYKPGVAATIEWMPDASALERSAWKLHMPREAEPLREQTIYRVEAFKVTNDMRESLEKPLPPLLCQVKGRFDYFPDLVKTLKEYGFLVPTAREEARMKEVEALVEIELLVDWVYYYFGQVDGRWRLIGLDAARCDFSA